MAVRKYLARDYRFYTSEDDGVTYIPISGISSWSFSIDNTSQDTSSFDNGSWGSTMYTQRTGSISLEGFMLVDSVTGVRDAGQASVDRAATQVGYEAYRYFKVAQVVVISGVANELGHFSFLGQAGKGDQGGATTDVDPWNIEVIFEGKPVGSGTFAYFN
jgi:hypothetical protein